MLRSARISNNVKLGGPPGRGPARSGARDLRLETWPDAFGRDVAEGVGALPESTHRWSGHAPAYPQLAGVIHRQATSPHRVIIKAGSVKEGVPLAPRSWQSRPAAHKQNPGRPETPPRPRSQAKSMAVADGSRHRSSLEAAEQPCHTRPKGGHHETPTAPTPQARRNQALLTTPAPAEANSEPELAASRDRRLGRWPGAWGSARWGRRARFASPRTPRRGQPGFRSG